MYKVYKVLKVTFFGCVKDVICVISHYSMYLHSMTPPNVSVAHFMMYRYMCYFQTSYV